MHKTLDYEDRVARAALWSAYGDALGFITELAKSRRDVVTRIGSATVAQTTAWRRRVGGKFGVDANLPAGCYSDDTQLRLATCRCIRSDGSFNVEAFARMELPIWPSYALGAGRGSKAAAAALARDGVTWFSNFYRSDGIAYVDGGGNGAAMRIQPHVWAAKDGLSIFDLARAIIRNAICTHGNLRGIVGAVFHGLCLWYARLHGKPPTISELAEVVNELTVVLDVVRQDRDLQLFWLARWEQETGAMLDEAFRTVQMEMNSDISLLQSVRRVESDAATYHNALEQIGGYIPSQRGSGTKSALLAAFLGDLFVGADPEPAIVCAANAVSSDTDSIATMVGALLGFNADRLPDSEILDRDYISRQATRLARIAMERPVTDISYPNLLTWQAPKTQMDVVVIGDDGLEVLVLGRVTEEGEQYSAKQSDAIFWQWLTVECGQRVLIKRRRNPARVRATQQADAREVATPIELPLRAVGQLSMPVLDEAGKETVPTVDELTSVAARSDFDPKVIGEHILLLSSGPDGVERAIAYAAIIAKSRLSRSRRR